MPRCLNHFLQRPQSCREQCVPSVLSCRSLISVHVLYRLGGVLCFVPVLPCFLTATNSLFMQCLVQLKFPELTPSLTPWHDLAKMTMNNTGSDQAILAVSLPCRKAEAQIQSLVL